MRALFTIILLFSCLLGKTEIPILEKEISISFSNESIVNALDKIQKQSNCVFSYRSNILNGTSSVTGEFKNKTIREVLSCILPKTVLIKPKGNYIILKERPVVKNNKSELSGYVYEANTNKKLANVTIYDKQTLQSVTTNDYGYYAINLPINNQCLTINKQYYEDTCIALRQSPESSLVNIAISPVKDSTLKDSLEWKNKLRDLGTKTNDLFKRFKGYINTLNVKDTITQNFQFSVLPYVGTNGKMSGSVYNRNSINLIGGYSRGNQLAEFGGVFNINKENMTGAQFAGMFNVVGDSVKGAQFAGFMNLTGKSVQGFQASGFMNLNNGTLKGMQGAGFMNINRNVYGVVGSGFMNLCSDTLMGIAGAGFMNVSNYSKGSIEGAGFMNVTYIGANNNQVAGFMNVTHQGTTRFQAAGFLNKAHMITGAQLGFLNYCDTTSGVPIGFLSFVKHGVHQVEISGDELFYANAGFRTGVNAFYNVISCGIQPTGTNFWNIGYGIGTSFKLAPNSRMDITLSSHHVSSGGFYSATSELNKLYIGMEYKFAKKMSLAFGPTFNLYMTDALLPQYLDTYHNLAPYTQYERRTRNDLNLKGWVGGKIAMRFF